MTHFVLILEILQSQDEHQLKSFQRKAEVSHEIQQLKSKMRDSQVLNLPELIVFQLDLKLDESTKFENHLSSLSFIFPPFRIFVPHVSQIILQGIRMLAYLLILAGFVPLLVYSFKNFAMN